MLCYGVAAVSEGNLAALRRSALSTYRMSKRPAALSSITAWCPSRIVFATTAFHVATLSFGFGAPAVALRVQPLSHGLQMLVLKHTDLWAFKAD